MLNNVVVSNIRSVIDNNRCHEIGVVLGKSFVCNEACTENKFTLAALYHFTNQYSCI